MNGTPSRPAVDWEIVARPSQRLLSAILDAAVVAAAQLCLDRLRGGNRRDSRRRPRWDELAIGATSSAEL